MIRSKANKLFSLFLAVSLLGSLASSKTVSAAEATVIAGTSSNFAVLAGETITNTGSSVITGDVGLHPGTAVPGKDDVVLTGEWHITDAVALTGKNDLVTAYNDAAGRTPQIISRELGGQTLTPGVYASNEKDFLLNGELILDGEGDPDAVFIFQTDSTLTTGSTSRVTLRNEATPCGVFWKIGSSATLGSYSYFAGRILAMTSISLGTGAEVKGQLLARNGSVTLDANKIISGKCASEVPTTATLHIIKKVVNENGETAVSGDFRIRVLKDGVDVEGSPSAGMDTPGRLYTLEAGTYQVTEEAVLGYAADYSGDTLDGTLTLLPGEHKTVIITNRKTHGSIEVEKYDDEGNRLPGAEFTLYKDDVKIGEPRVSDNNGILRFEGLAKGKYTLKETKAPDGYVLKDTLDEVEIVEDQEKVVVTVTNDRIMGQINVISKDRETGDVLPGAEFTLYKDDLQVGKSEITDEDGRVTFTELPKGTYTIKETKAPEGYSPSETIDDVEVVEDNETVEVIVENDKIKGEMNITGKIKIKKVDAKTGEALSGGEFTLYKDGLQVGQPMITGEDGTVTFSQLEKGIYSIKETKAPEGYSSSETIDDVEVVEDNETVEVIVENDKIKGEMNITGKIKIKKVDAKTGEALSGGEFTLYKDGLQVGQPMITGEDGTVTFSQLEKGIYSIKETKAPVGYVLNAEEVDAEIMKDNETVEVILENDQIMGQINLLKVDAKTGKFLSGAEFEITDEMGNIFFKGMTDHHGKLSVKVPYGKYIIKEITAPENYIRSDQKYSIDVTKNGQIFNLEVRNSRLPEEDQTLPKAGNQASSALFFMGLFAIAGGAVLLKKRGISK